MIETVTQHAGKKAVALGRRHAGARYEIREPTPAELIIGQGSIKGRDRVLALALAGEPSIASHFASRARNSVPAIVSSALAASCSPRGIAKLVEDVLLRLPFRPDTLARHGPVR